DTNGVIGGNEVFKDRETGSRWQQSSLEAISGPLKGTHLALYPFLLTTWDEWRKQHADRLLLKPLPGYANRLADMNKIINQGFMGLAGPAPKGAFSGDNWLRLRDTIAGLETEGGAKAYPMSALRRARGERHGGRHSSLDCASAGVGHDYGVCRTGGREKAEIPGCRSGGRQPCGPGSSFDMDRLWSLRRRTYEGNPVEAVDSRARIPGLPGPSRSEEHMS